MAVAGLRLMYHGLTQPGVMCKLTHHGADVGVSAVKTAVTRTWALQFPKRLNSTQAYNSQVKENYAKEAENKINKTNKINEVPQLQSIDHFRSSKAQKQGKDNGAYILPHPIWSEEELNSVEITHRVPENFTDKAAFYSVKILRNSFDIFSGFNWRKRSEKQWLRRIIFLETVAGVPGMMAAMVRHLNSLRRMQRDHGWIHTLLEEAENERMHLMTALQIRKPGLAFRGCVLLAQGVFVNVFFVSYLISPYFCHRFVGYLEEEAVKTYTKCLQDIDSGSLPWKNSPAPPIAKDYWQLPPDAMMRDVILAIRADEAHHRVVNHTLGSLKEDEPNPYGPGR
ncbi:alternative oxidase, mitochondrial [Lingula anatina]|uniref:Alternative oxidase, mitochondrial n=1 Tax=Lingula anatina TaxID=7574 RepID=A0A1S3H3B4_LINAN|nr:alternative oxidase, mitochondrial [Lingula anatina]|eukprot:XP_013379624.1 alternative oxidase, mitochondrial [Lingula anatina]